MTSYLLAFTAAASAYNLQLHPTPRTASVARTVPVVAKLAETDQSNWCTDVEGADGLTVVFFYAPWCRNCKAVRPKLERLQRKYADEDVKFLQANFKTETKLCYNEKVFNFPTVHFYLPGIGRVSRAVLTASNTDETMKGTLNRLLQGRSAFEEVTSQALSPVVQYVELVGALKSLADLAAPPADSESVEGEGFGNGLSPKKESLRLRKMVKYDERRLAELEQLFLSLDADADGELRLSELEAAAGALQPPRADGASSLFELPVDASLSVDRSTFVALMVDKAVADFAAGEKALLPAFEALDADGDGTVTQEQLLEVIDNFCGAQPQADGCDIEQGPRNLQLARAFEAFADGEQLLDYERFVSMVSGRADGFGEGDCELMYDEDGESTEVGVVSVPGGGKPIAELDPMMGERECFGEAVTDEGDDDVACDAWFFGEDPTKEKEVVVSDPVKIATLKAAGEASHAAKVKKDAEMAAFLARRAALKE